MTSNLATLPDANVAEQATPIGETAARLMSGTRVTIMGRLVADPELRYTGAGVAWARMSLALRGTDGIILQNVLVSGRVAETSATNLRTGNRVRVGGTLRGRQWIGDDGVGRYDVDIMAGTVEILAGSAQ